MAKLYLSRLQAKKLEGMAKFIKLYLSRLQAKKLKVMAILYLSRL